MSHVSRLLSPVAVLLVAVPLSAQQPIPETAPQAPRIEGAEVKRLVDKGEAVVVDVRSKEAWDLGHVQGALHIPLNDLPHRLKELPKEKLIAAYCT
jgi:predicted sulfurtransferase